MTRLEALTYNKEQIQAVWLKEKSFQLWKLKSAFANVCLAESDGWVRSPDRVIGGRAMSENGGGTWKKKWYLFWILAVSIIN